MVHVAIIGNEPSSLLNFRDDLIRTVASFGHRATAMSAPASADQIRQIEALGAQFRSYPVQRNGLNPLRDIQTFFALRKAFKELKPDVVLAYTIKPVIWSGIAAYLTNVPKFYALIEGLGYAFQDGGWRRKLIGMLAALLYRISLQKAADKVIFLNQDNKNFFLKEKIIPSEKVALIDGIGLDLDWYAQRPFTESHPIFLCIARLLGEKGLREYAQAAYIVKRRYPDATFRILGPTDPSPDRISLDHVHEWQHKGLIEYLGVSDDVRPYLAASHVYVLPSYHEGMPRTVLEAMATGRPILTTNAPGCKETVVQGENGFLVPVKDAEALAERMIWFIENRDQWERMGQASRRMAEERFNVHKINAQILSIIFDENR